jgi:hypothetical protein
MKRGEYEAVMISRRDVVYLLSLRESASVIQVLHQGCILEGCVLVLLVGWLMISVARCNPCQADEGGANTCEFQYSRTLVKNG